jgi:hypothetical protein
MAMEPAAISARPARTTRCGRGGDGAGEAGGEGEGDGEAVGEADDDVATLTVKTEDGGLMQIVTTDNTRVMKGRGVTVKISELKVGDGVMAAGNLDAPKKTLHAAVVFATDAAQLAEMKANLGKTYIVGRVMAIDLDDAKMTVERPDHVAQTIGFDETTSFKRGRGGRGAVSAAWQWAADRLIHLPPEPHQVRESITLADVKVGDNVAGAGRR